MKALSLAPEHALAHMFLGCVQVFSGRAAQGAAECEHALSLNRNLARTHEGPLGALKMMVGRAIETEKHVQEALQVSAA